MRSPSKRGSPHRFVAHYTTKDLVLYALGIGCGEGPYHERYHEGDKQRSIENASHRGNDRERMFLYEGSPDFAAFPTFPLVLTFLADRDGGNSLGNGGIRPFPPPMMQHGESGEQTVPVIQVFQSLRMHGPVPLPLLVREGEGGKGFLELPGSYDSPVKTLVRSRTLSAVPKKIGTFITTETEICSIPSTSSDIELPSLLCTCVSTALMVGENNARQTRQERESGCKRAAPIPSASGSATAPSRDPDAQLSYQTFPTQALLYRLGSGDYNSIHVEPLLIPMMSEGDVGGKPILHGLCSLGYAVRAALQYWRKDDELSNCPRIDYIAARFRKPVFVGDKICVRLWVGGLGKSVHSESGGSDTVGNDPRRKTVLSFQVYDVDTEKVVLDGGRIEASVDRSVSKL